MVVTNAKNFFPVNSLQTSIVTNAIKLTIIAVKILKLKTLTPIIFRKIALSHGVKGVVIMLISLYGISPLPICLAALKFHNSSKSEIG